MSITSKVQGAAEYDTWKQERIRSGASDYSVDDFEAHLRATLVADRLDRIRELIAELRKEQFITDDDYREAVARIERLTNLSEENQ